jgi:hypothetical protein
MRTLYEWQGLRQQDYSTVQSGQQEPQDPKSQPIGQRVGSIISALSGIGSALASIGISPWVKATLLSDGLIGGANY